MALRKGDTYKLEVQISNQDGIIGNEGIEAIEFVFDTITKMYYSDESGEVFFTVDHFVVPFSQEETFSFEEKSINYQVRVKFFDGSVKGSGVKKVNIFESLSKEVL